MKAVPAGGHCRTSLDNTWRTPEAILALLPASRWETAYLHQLLALEGVVCFHRGRVKFVSSRDGAAVAGNPGANMILGLNVDRARFARAFGPLGLCLELCLLVDPGAG